LRILLTGAKGFTGKYLSAMAQAQGHTVLPLQADLTQRDAVKTEVAVLQPSHVVHLAAISFVGHLDQKSFYDVNLFGTLNLLDALDALDKRPRSVLLASSANVYGNCQTSPIPEEQTPAPLNHYGVSKLAMEHMARTYGDRLPVVITRPFNYIGAGQSASFVIPKLVDHFSRRAPCVQLGAVSVQREFNDVQMVCGAYLQLLQHGKPGETYNVCSGQPHTLQHVIDTLKHLTGHQIRVEVNPAFMRSNEVRRLCGDPAKLHALLAAHNAMPANPPLEDTLRRMLGAAGK
jgi:nucleoside-diphosphate-sugar epimerase